MRRAAALAVALALALAACGGGGKKADPTLANTGNTGDSGGDGDGVRASAGGDARVIQRTQMGGVVELLGDRAVAIERASKEMEAHCGPDNYTITQEGEEAIDGGGAGTSPSSSTRTATAWRVHYQCNGAAPPPPP